MKTVKKLELTFGTPEWLQKYKTNLKIA